MPIGEKRCRPSLADLKAGPNGKYRFAVEAGVTLWIDPEASSSAYRDLLDKLARRAASLSLSRNVHFISGLMERKVDFVACDMPSANAFMINVYAAVAQEERRMISDRTKAGLAAAKARGVKLGGPRLPAINETRQADALERARAIPILSELTGISARAVGRAMSCSPMKGNVCLLRSRRASSVTIQSSRVRTAVCGEGRTNCGLAGSLPASEDQA
jgi:hypothetical protein